MIALFATGATAAEVRYKIDTMDDIHDATAVVDTELPDREIRLPKYMPNSADFLDGFEYIYLTPTGIEKMNIDGTTTPITTSNNNINNITAIAGSGNRPDFLVAEGTTVTHYSFTGSEYLPNPALSWAGYSHIVSIGSKNLDYNVLTTQQSDYIAMTDEGEMAQVPYLSLLPGELQNPIATSVFKDHYGRIVIDGETVKYYKDNQSLTATIAGLNGAKSISASEGGNIAVVVGKEVRHYNYIDDSFHYNSVLSVTSGLVDPTCIATRPGSYDKLIVDGDEIKYYMWTGNSLEYNPAMSKTVAGLQSMGSYISTAYAESIFYSLGSADYVRLTVDPSLKPQEADTNIKWYIATGSNPEWVSVALDNWVPVSESTQVRWKAVLSTANPKNTPRINPDIVIQTNSKPLPPDIEVPPMTGSDKCYYTTAPEFRWMFNDPDGDIQSAFKVTVKGGSLNESPSSIPAIPSSTTAYTYDSQRSNKLYKSGVSKFEVTVMVWDEVGKQRGYLVEDAGIKTEQFCVIAFDAPEAIVHFQSNDNAQDYNYKKLIEKATPSQLPSARAGSSVDLQLKSVGVTDVDYSFLYNGREAYMREIIEEGYSGENREWYVSFYTDANKEVCPDGTIVYGYLTGNGIPNLMYFDQSTPGPIPSDKWWHWEGYRKWADGVVVIEKSMFDTWNVVLQGREEGQD